MLNEISLSGFPNTFIPDSKKNTEEYHKQAVQAITNRSLNQNFTANYIAMNESVNFFQSLQGGEEFKFLQQSEDGEVLPAKWMDINRIYPKLSIVLGEFIERGYDINVRAINKEAVSRRILEKERILVQMRLKPAAEMLENTIGLPFQQNENLPENEEELDDYMISSYKETSEFVMESALKWLAKHCNWDYTRFALMRDILIMGRCFAKVEIVNGLPVIRRVDPRLLIYDVNASDDYLSDATYWGEVRYMSIAELIEHYNLTEEEVKKLKETSKSNPTAEFVRAGHYGFPTTRDNQVIYYREEAGELRVLVVTAYWVDTKKWNHKESKDQYGNIHLKKTDEDGEDVVKRRVKIWRRGTLIGDTILKEWGEAENMVRSVDSYYDTPSPYIGCIPYFLNGTSVSLVQRMKPLQDSKNIAAYNLQLAMARSGAKGITIDVSQIPEGMDLDQVVKYLKVVGVNLIDSKKDGIISNFNQFSTYDMTISDSIIRYLEIMDRYDREMDAITGINEARQGIVHGASQTVGVTQSALFQSNLSTAPLFKLFRGFASKAFNLQAGLVKIAWAAKEKFAPIIGDVGVDFLTTDVDLDLNDYGVFVEEIPPLIDDINSFRNFVFAALQSGTLTFIDALDLMLEKDIKVATRRFKRIIRRKEQQQLMEQQAAQEREMMLQQQLSEQELQNDQLNRELDLQLEALRGKNALKNTLTKGKVALAKEKINLLK